jgi:hypothetical protein
MISYESHTRFKFIADKYGLLAIFSIFEMRNGTRRLLGLYSLSYLPSFSHFIAASSRDSEIAV